MSRLTDCKLSLLVKLGSIAVHAEEVLESPAAANVNPADFAAISTLLVDPEVVEWRKLMDGSGFLPKKRNVT